MKLTPGPWRFNNQGPAICADLPEWGEVQIALLHSTRFCGSSYEGNTVFAQTLDGDAHLIAAAPEMYEALRICLKRLNEIGGLTGWVVASAVDAANAALAKADGKESQ